MSAGWYYTTWFDSLRVEDHAAMGKAQLLWQYRQRPRIEGFLGTLLDELPEDASWQVYAERWPLTAVGEQLDVLGRIVGVGRGNRTDAEYRPLILAKIRVNRSSGTIGDLTDWLAILGVTDELIADCPGGEVRVELPSTGWSEELAWLASLWVAGGVKLLFLARAWSGFASFTHGPLGGGRVASTTQGWGDVGGRFGMATSIGGRVARRV